MSRMATMLQGLKGLTRERASRRLFVILSVAWMAASWPHEHDVVSAEWAPPSRIAC